MHLSTQQKLTCHHSNSDFEVIVITAFPTPKIGYVSIQRNVNDGKFHFLKTEDGGKTWVEKEYAERHYFTQGIGFLNDKIGWIGGSSSYGTYETINGGATWRSVPSFGKGLNKFQFFGDSLGYAAGRGIYKIAIKKTVKNAE